MMQCGRDGPLVSGLRSLVGVARPEFDWALEEMDLQDFRIFSRVAAVQNLTAVGHEMGLTPGTISKRLQALEDHLQVRLFDRSTRSIRITAEGQTFLLHVEQILADVERARAAIGASVAQPRGAIRVCVPNWLGRYHVTPAMSEFLQRYPEIEVRLDLLDRESNLLDEGYDMALRLGELDDSALIARRIGTLEPICTAAPQYLERRGVPVIPADLAQHDCLTNYESVQWKFAAREGEPADSRTVVTPHVRVSGRFRSNAALMLYGAAINGQGILRCDRQWVKTDLECGRLVQVLPGWVVQDDVAVYAVYLGAKHVAPRLRVFVDFLAEWFRVRERGPGGGEPQQVAQLAAE